jgi:hypothetical protein
LLPVKQVVALVCTGAPSSETLGPTACPSAYAGIVFACAEVLYSPDVTPELWGVPPDFPFFRLLTSDVDMEKEVRCACTFLNLKAAAPRSQAC